MSACLQSHVSYNHMQRLFYSWNTMDKEAVTIVSTSLIPENTNQWQVSQWQKIWLVWFFALRRADGSRWIWRGPRWRFPGRQWRRWRRSRRWSTESRRLEVFKPVSQVLVFPRITCWGIWKETCSCFFSFKNINEISPFVYLHCVHDS